MCSSEKNFLSKETTDFIIQIWSSNLLPRQSSIHQNMTHEEGRKELWFNLQNTKIISGQLACWGLKPKSRLPAWLKECMWSVPPCDELCSDSAGEAVPTCPGKEWAPHPAEAAPWLPTLPGTPPAPFSWDTSKLSIKTVCCPVYHFFLNVISAGEIKGQVICRKVTSSRRSCPAWGLGSREKNSVGNEVNRGEYF